MSSSSSSPSSFESFDGMSAKTSKPESTMWSKNIENREKSNGFFSNLNNDDRGY